MSARREYRIASVATRIQRFDRKWWPEPNSGCHIWAGMLDRHGYGKLNVKGRTLAAHRLAWELKNGPIPAGMQIDHRCRITCCVNPKHMEVVTFAENYRRRVFTKRRAPRK